MTSEENKFFKKISTSRISKNDKKILFFEHFSAKVEQYVSFPEDFFQCNTIYKSIVLNKHSIIFMANKIFKCFPTHLSNACALKHSFKNINIENGFKSVPFLSKNLLFYMTSHPLILCLPGMFSIISVAQKEFRKCLLGGQNHLDIFQFFPLF